MEKSSDHKPCYGQMFPDMSTTITGVRLVGKAFSAEIRTSGLAVDAHNVEADIEQWDDCRSCPEFAHCWHLCVSRAILQMNLKTR